MIEANPSGRAGTYGISGEFDRMAIAVPYSCLRSPALHGLQQFIHLLVELAQLIFPALGCRKLRLTACHQADLAGRKGLIPENRLNKASETAVSSCAHTPLQKAS